MGREIKEQNNGGNGLSFRYRNECQCEENISRVKMTLGSIFGSVVGPSSSLFEEQSAASRSNKFLSERNSALYQHGYSKQHKGKSKSEKKHAILSALTLLAFLFFLSILQNCIREQTVNRGTVMMFGPTGGTAPTGHQAKDEESREPEDSSRSKRSVEWLASDRTDRGWRSRALLGVDEGSRQEGKRQEKFIRNLSAVNNWTTELSQISERELAEQKLKTLHFPLVWRHKGLRATLPLRVAENPFRNRSVPQVLRRFSKRERTSTSTEPLQAATKEPTWDYKRPDNFYPSPPIPEIPNNTSHHNYTHTSSPWITRRESTPTPHLTRNTSTTTNPLPKHPSTTPRNRRSDYSTPTPSHYDDYDSYADPTRDDPHAPPTPPVGLDLNTFQTFPVYNYYNHRPPVLLDNQTTDTLTPEPLPQDIDRIHSQPPLFHPTKTSPPHHTHRHRHPPHHHHPLHPHSHPHLRNRHPSDTPYTFSPYRKTAPPYDPPHFHDHLHHDYHPPLLLAKYELQHDDPGFDLLKFLWTMLTSFAKPLTNLVPSFAKDNPDDAQCYDLLVCEAQRASRLMGPTAEALATTVGTLLTWAATDHTRQMVIDAINSGRDNTCQQQIRDCEHRSGGKSAITVIAQVMEMKLR